MVAGMTVEVSAFASSRPGACGVKYAVLLYASFIHDRFHHLLPCCGLVTAGPSSDGEEYKEPREAGWN